MTHDEYWKSVWDKARERLDNLFADSETKIDDLTGDDKFIDSYHDAKKILSFVFSHCPSCDEKACAILSVNEALHALNELSENASAKAGAVAR